MKLNKLGVALGVLAFAGLIQGCGSGSTTAPAATGASGKLTQGPVVGATIYADNVSAGTRFTLDSGSEVSTSTDADGNFVLPSVPDYNYILVSVGGTDKLTNKPAIQMIAPAGSANVTPLTTLVALDTTGLVKAKIEALGTKFDVDISSDATPALLNLSKSIETVVASLTATVSKSAGSAAVSSSQLAAVQVQAMQSISTSLSTTAQDLTKPASLNTAMTTAVTAAVTNINAKNTNIVIPLSQAATIATNAVTASTTVVLGAASVGSTTAAGTTTKVPEASVITTASSATLDAAATSTANTVSATTTVTATPPNYTPPAVPVSTVITTPVTSTGSTGGSGSF